MADPEFVGELLGIGNDADDVTLTVGIAVAAGVVLVSDSRETFRDRESDVVSCRDDQPKIYPVGRYALGVSGPGAWARRLVDRLKLESYDSGARFAEAAHELARADDGLPAFNILAAGDKALWLLQSEKRGDRVAWLAPVDVTADKFRCIGIPHLATWLLSTLWQRDLGLQGAAAVAALAVKASAQVFPGVGGPIGFWCSEPIDGSLAEAAADAWLAYARSFPWSR